LQSQFWFNGCGWKKNVNKGNLDARNNLARSHTEHPWSWFEQLHQVVRAQNTSRVSIPFAYRES